jgi:hypothetical protein
VLSYTIESTFGEQFVPSLYDEPAFARLKSILCGLCDLQDDMKQLYTGLNYIEVLGIVSVDGAKCYLPIITSAYVQYFASISPTIQIYRPSEIISVQYLLMNGVVISRIYYQIYVNTPQPFNSFNYQIKNTLYSRIYASQTGGIESRNSMITSESDLVKNGRTDLLTKVKRSSKNDDLIMAWLPNFAVETATSHNDIVLEKKQALENVLVNFWQKCRLSLIFSLKF